MGQLVDRPFGEGEFSVMSVCLPLRHNGRLAFMLNLGKVSAGRRRRKGTSRNSWMQEVTTGMREREIERGGINNLKWVDREWRRKKIKTSGTEICGNMKTLSVDK